ncbi:hypothetical protein [Methylobacterium organophilum]|nr:hypothetical protein [Methylobacterium organophilum]
MSDADIARALTQALHGMPRGFAGAPGTGLPEQPQQPLSVQPVKPDSSPGIPVAGSPAATAFPQGLPIEGAGDPAQVGGPAFTFGARPMPQVPGAAMPAPQPPARPSAADLVAAAPRPLSFGPSPIAPRPASDGAMTVPLPPQRPGDLASRADLPAEGARPIMAQGGVPGAEEPSLFDRFMTGLKNDDGLLLNLGIGLMTQKGFGNGLAAGLSSYQAGEGRRAASKLAQAEFALKTRKLAQEQGATNATRSWLLGKGYDAVDVDGAIAASLAGRSEALTNLLQRAAPKPADAPSGYTIDPRTGRASFIPGGPQDPATISAQSAAKGDDSFTLSPGQTRYSGDTGQAIASAPDKKPENFDVESKLRGEFSKQLGTFQDVHDGYGRVIAATEQRASNPKGVSPASDIGLIFGYMKMLDPGSVVREGEYATAQNAAGLPERVRNAYNKALNGEFLTPEQRQDFVEQADRLYGKARSGAEGVAERYRGLAGAYGVNPERSAFLPPAFKPPVVGPSRTAPAPTLGDIETEMKRRGLNR